MLDLYCGYGGFSDAFAGEGFDVVGVDFERSIAKWYPYDLVLQDVRTFDGARLTGHFDVITSSPPCDQFSVARHDRLVKPDMSCVDAVKRIVDQAKPRYWIMENVRGAIRFLGPPTARLFPWYFWGNFPQFLQYCERAPRKTRGLGRTRLLRDPRRVAMVPLELGVPIARAIRVSLENRQ